MDCSRNRANFAVICICTVIRLVDNPRRRRGELEPLPKKVPRRSLTFDRNQVFTFVGAVPPVTLCDRQLTQFARLRLGRRCCIALFQVPTGRLTGSNRLLILLLDFFLDVELFPSKDSSYTARSEDAFQTQMYRPSDDCS